MKTKSYVGLYGNVAILKGYCAECACTSFVIDGLLQCCDSRFEIDPTKYKRESTPEQRRRALPRKLKLEVLDSQGHRCFYCHRRFGSLILKGVRMIRLRIQFDHFVPYAHSQNNGEYNFVAACHVCNGLKTDHFFQTSEQAELFLFERWQEKGYSDLGLSAENN